jgi:hypothetical protein
LLNLESILNNSEFNNPVITSEMVINDIKICQTDITVNPGATLTINGTLIMSNGKKIIVNPRGKLIVQNNGKITSNCEWGGVEVYGDQNVNTPQGTTADGYALIRTGGIIENAKIGVKTIDEGIVEANGAKFLNNYIGIYMSPQYSLSTVLFNQTPNISKVLNSDFKIDKELKSISYNIGVTRQSLNSFIKMEDVKYTSVENNSFIVNNLQNRGIAIFGYKVDSRIKDNLFSGIYSGVEISGFSRFFFNIQNLNLINNNQFTNVSRGITIYNNNRPSINSNNFSIANTNYELSEDGYFEYNWAIASSNNGIEIKDNIISSNDGRAYGSIINNSSIYKKATIDQLLKNTFQHLYIGSQFEFIQKGLRPLCNTYSNITKHAWSISPNRADKNNSFPNIGNPSKNQVGGNLFYDSDINEFKHIRSRKIFNYVAANDPIIAIPTDNTTNLSVEQVTLSNASFCEEVQFNLNYFLCESQECELQQLIYSYEAENDTDRKDILESAIIDKFVENEDESGLLFFLTDNSLLQTYSKELFMTYFDKGDITTAEYYMALMPIATQAEIDFVVLFETLLDLRSEFKSLSDLTQTQINTLNSIKSNNNDASLFAANMLKFGIGTKFNQNPSLWDNEPETPMLLLSLDNKNPNTIKFYPNPSTTENYLQIESIVGDEIQSVEMYNSIGKLVYKELVDKKVGIRIENKKLPIGLYNVKVNTRKNASTFKYIKQN